MNTEWASAPDFAEVAETLGVDTVDIMAWLPEQAVLFTPVPEAPDPAIFVAQLWRDRDSILRHGPKRFVKLTSEFLAEVDEKMDAKLRE